MTPIDLHLSRAAAITRAIAAPLPEPSDLIDSLDIRWGVVGHRGGRDIEGYRLTHTGFVGIDLPIGEYDMTEWGFIRSTRCGINIEARLVEMAVKATGVRLTYDVIEVD